MPEPIKVSLNWMEDSCRVEQARVMIENVYLFGGEREEGQTHFVFTKEGLIVDVINAEGLVIGTACYAFEDLADRVINSQEIDI